VLAAVLAVACVAGIAASSPVLTVLIGSVLVVLVAAIMRNVRRHARVARALAADSRPGAFGGVAVRLRPLSSHAGVAGLYRPEIFLDPSLIRRLTAAELRAVVLHERRHQQRRDPLRLIVLASLAPALGRFRAGRAWIERRRADIEIRADADVLRHGVPRPVLARALLKLGGNEMGYATAGFSSAVDLRLQALVDPDREPPAGSRWRSVLLSVAAAGVVCVVAAAHHLVMAAGSFGCVLAGC
jgi:beta-lactamase regulating signal transducer with metallopeptidase domain